MNNIAFFYAYKGDSEPKMMAFSGGVDETKLAMQLVEDVFPNAPSYVTATYGYTGDNRYVRKRVEENSSPMAGKDIDIFWLATSIKVRHAYGHRVAVKDKSGNPLVVDIGSEKGLEKLQEGIRMNAMNQRKFKLVHVLVDTKYEVREIVPVNDENLHLCFKTGSIFVDFTQAPYSDTTDSILSNFIWPERVDMQKPLTVFESLMKCCTKSAEDEAKNFLDQIASMRVSPDASENRRAAVWDECVSRATTALDDWSQTLEVLDYYNDATRRLLINEVVKQVSKYAGRTLLVEPFLCKDQENPPAHFRGTGPLDYLMGVGKATCIELFPTQHHISAAVNEDLEDEDIDERESIMDGSEEDEDEVRFELQDGDPLSAIRTSFKVEEAKQHINTAALRQLLAQIFDKVFVSEESIVNIANHIEETLNSDIAESGTKKRPISDCDIHEPPVRKFQKLTGVLTTGHTWKIFKFQFKENERAVVDAKLQIEYAGHFTLPVLQYGGEGIDSSSKTPDGVDRKLVELLMAALSTADV